MVTITLQTSMNRFIHIQQQQHQLGWVRALRSAASPGCSRSQRLVSSTLGPPAAAVAASIGGGEIAKALAAASNSPWWTWSVLLWSAAVGVWSERNTDWGAALSGALVSTLVALLASNLGIVSATSPVYSVVNSYLLPLAVPLLLFSADMRRLLTSTGRLLLAFCLGSVATILGTLVAMKLVPLKPSLAGDGWKIAAALMSRHIGGAVNYVAVSEALGVTPSVVASGLAADNLVCAVYFTTLYALAATIPAEEDAAGDGRKVNEAEEVGIRVVEASLSLAISASLCWAGLVLTSGSGGDGSLMLATVTSLAVLVATALPRHLAPLVPSAQGVAILLLQVFFASVGAASGSVAAVAKRAPSLLLFSALQVGVHLALVLSLRSLLPLRLLLLGSNANVGGPTTAGGMASAKGWTSLIVPAILCGVLGITIATPISLALGVALLQHLS